MGLTVKYDFECDWCGKKVVKIETPPYGDKCFVIDLSLKGGRAQCEICFDCMNKLNDFIVEIKKGAL